MGFLLGGWFVFLFFGDLILRPDTVHDPGINRTNMQVSLGERDFDTCFHDRVIDKYRHFALNHESVIGIGNPEKQPEIQGTVPKAEEKGNGFGIVKNPVVGPGRFQ
jgi:hypothetical protein